jgi:hypothetical protein
MYKKQWTEFEVQALAYSILRKNLYPNYFIRGEYKFDKCRCDIAIFKNIPDAEPELKLIVEVKKASVGTRTGQQVRYEALLGVPCVYVRGGEQAYKVIELVTPHL